jgi:hypothetical protein
MGVQVEKLQCVPLTAADACLACERDKSVQTARVRSLGVYGFVRGFAML